MKRFLAIILAAMMALCAGNALAQTVVSDNDQVITDSHKQIVIEEGVTQVRFRNVTVQPDDGSGVPALIIEGTGDEVTLIFEGNNTITGGSGRNGESYPTQEGAYQPGGLGSNGGSGISASRNVRITVESGGTLNVSGGKGGDGGYSYPREGGKGGDGGDGISVTGAVSVSGATVNGGRGGNGGSSANNGGRVGGRGGKGICASGTLTVKDVEARGGDGGNGGGGRTFASNGGDGEEAVSAQENGIILAGAFTAQGGKGGDRGEGGTADTFSGRDGGAGTGFTQEQIEQYMNGGVFCYVTTQAQQDGMAAVIAAAASLPQTGDPSSLMGWTALLFASAAGMKMRRKK